MFKSRFILLFCFTFLSTLYLKAQILKIYPIKTHVSEYIIAHHFGNKIIKFAAFEKEHTDMVNVQIPYNIGVSYLFFPDSSKFEFFVTDDFDTISIDITDLNEVKISGSNQAVLYQEIISLQDKYIDQTNLFNGDRENRTSVDHDQISIIIENTSDSIIMNLPGTFLASYLKAQKTVSIPSDIQPMNIPADSLLKFNMYYYQKHFLDNIDLTDKRLLYTPVFTDKIQTYLNKIVPQNQNELIKAVDLILSAIKKTDRNYQFVLEFLLEIYHEQINKPYYESVFLHLIKNYYFTGEATWISDKQIYLINNEYNRRKPASLGEKAPNIILYNNNGKQKELYQLKSNSILIYFYNLKCQVCVKTIPFLKKLSAIYNTDEFQIFAVCIGDSEKDWKNYVKVNKLNNWTNVFEDNQKANNALKYNIQLTPTLFLLNKEFRITDKNLNLKELERILSEKH